MISELMFPTWLAKSGAIYLGHTISKEYTANHRTAGLERLCH